MGGPVFADLPFSVRQLGSLSPVQILAVCRRYWVPVDHVLGSRAAVGRRSEWWSSPTVRRPLPPLCRAVRPRLCDPSPAHGFCSGAVVCALRVGASATPVRGLDGDELGAVGGAVSVSRRRGRGLGAEKVDSEAVGGAAGGGRRGGGGGEAASSGQAPPARRRVRSPSTGAGWHHSGAPMRQAGSVRNGGTQPCGAASSALVLHLPARSRAHGGSIIGEVLDRVRCHVRNRRGC